MGRSKSRAVRKVALIKARMRAGEDWVEIAVANISATGLMAKCPVPPVRGAEVEIRHRGAVITGQVVWSTATRFGMESAAPIDVDEFTAGSGLETRQAGDVPARRRLWHWRGQR